MINICTYVLIGVVETAISNAGQSEMEIVENGFDRYCIATTISGGHTDLLKKIISLAANQL